jgi:hypothetical protein
MRGDLIDVFKIANHLYDPEVTQDLLNWSSEERTRGNSNKLFLKRFNTNFGKNTFSSRVVRVWNALSQDVLNANNVKTFESRLDKFMRDQSIVYEYRSDFQTNDRFY